MFFCNCNLYKTKYSCNKASTKEAHPFVNYTPKTQEFKSKIFLFIKYIYYVFYVDLNKRKKWNKYLKGDQAH